MAQLKLNRGKSLTSFSSVKGYKKPFIYKKKELLFVPLSSLRIWVCEIQKDWSKG